MSRQSKYEARIYKELQLELCKNFPSLSVRVNKVFTSESIYSRTDLLFKLHDNPSYLYKLPSFGLKCRLEVFAFLIDPS